MPLPVTPRRHVILCSLISERLLIPFHTLNCSSSYGPMASLAPCGTGFKLTCQTVHILCMLMVAHLPLFLSNLVSLKAVFLALYCFWYTSMTSPMLLPSAIHISLLMSPSSWRLYVTILKPLIPGAPNGNYRPTIPSVQPCISHSPPSLPLHTPSMANPSNLWINTKSLASQYAIISHGQTI